MRLEPSTWDWINRDARYCQVWTGPESGVWPGASLVPQGFLSSDKPAYLLQPELSWDNSAQTLWRVTLQLGPVSMQRWERKDKAAESPFRGPGSNRCYVVFWHRTELQSIGSTFLWNHFCVVALCWHCFLPISDFGRRSSRLWRLVRATSFLFSLCQEIVKVFPTYLLFTGNWCPVAWDSGNCCVCSAYLDRAEDLQIYF